LLFYDSFFHKYYFFMRNNLIQFYKRCFLSLQTEEVELLLLKKFKRNYLFNSLKKIAVKLNS